MTKRETISVKHLAHQDHVHPLTAEQLEELRILGADRARSKRAEQNTDAFFCSAGEGRNLVNDEVAESMAEEYLTSATSGEETHAINSDRPTPEEIGGPFVETSPDQEFAAGVDESNPVDAEPAAQPTVGRWERTPIITSKDTRSVSE